MHVCPRMRGSEKLVVLIAVAVPLLVALFAWRMFVNWVAGPYAAPATPEVAGAAATSAAAVSTLQPTPRPTIGAPPTAQTNRPTTRPAPTLVPAADTLASAQTAAEDPGAAVSNFYALVSQHQFDSAVQLWSPRMRAAFPPEVNLDQRFSQTRDIQLQRADVVSEDQTHATVAVDLVESTSETGQHHFIGNWLLVRGPNGWMLDQPQLQPAP